jgi:hypothetical protein
MVLGLKITTVHDIESSECGERNNVANWMCSKTNSRGNKTQYNINMFREQSMKSYEIMSSFWIG